MNREKVIKYINEKYDSLQESPWEENPSYITFKHKDNKKWFGLIMDVSFEKLKIKQEGMVHIINLKNIPEIIGGLRKQLGILPAYHMNKKHWISVVLQSDVPQEETEKLLELAFEVTR